MLWILSLLLLTSGDPRPGLVRLQLDGRPEEALAAAEVAQAADPERAAAAGLDYLRGHLLESLGRGHEAHLAFVSALGSTPALTGYSRYRLAANQIRMDHPEVAAGLLATLLARQPPAAVVPAASRLLAQSVSEGGDCRLLAALKAWRLPAAEDRRLELARADCMLREGDPEAARRRYLDLLRAAPGDEIARQAAERLVQTRPGPREGSDVALLLGLTFHRHRLFRKAIVYLEQGLGGRPAEGAAGGRSGATDQSRREALYALARSYFWLGEYREAAVRFAELAAERDGGEEAARDLFQQGRSLELGGDWSDASASYRRAFLADSGSRWTGAALLAALRVEWRGGNEAGALELLPLLAARPGWRELLARAYLFLASSDLARGRSDRAGAWLDAAARTREAPVAEIAYWRGRLAELEAGPEGAVGRYLEGLIADPYHPLSLAARQRLDGELAAAARRHGLRLAASERNRDLYGAWLLLGGGDPQGLEARRHLERHLVKDDRGRALLEMRRLAPGDWPLWRATLRQPEELLLALGIVEHGTTVVERHFPVSDPALALTASSLLQHTGLVRASLYRVEVLSQRLPPDLPAEWLPADYQRLLYPLAYRQLIEAEAARFGVDPLLLASIIREESRFDPLAMSAASARGLTQFVLPTAFRLLPETGLSSLDAEDLHRPEVSIALGAAYLAELQQRFAGRTPLMVAAYNAGEDQAQLWRSYCYGLDGAEYYSKVGFSETRNYLRKVLASRARYGELYAAPVE